MKNLHFSFLFPVIGITLLLTGCSSSSDGTQRYSWPLATASPEDTVTQIFAEKFAEEISALSDGRMKIPGICELHLRRRPRPAGDLCRRRYPVYRTEYGSTGIVHERSGRL